MNESDQFIWEQQRNKECSDAIKAKIEVSNPAVWSRLQHVQYLEDE